jgi:hypothetical protein
MLRGENFEIKAEDGIENLGFFTTRIVKANTPEEAELKAVEMVKTDKDLLESLSEKREFEPKIYLEEMWTVRWWKRIGGKGYTFYSMEPKE